MKECLMNVQTRFRDNPPCNYVTFDHTVHQFRQYVWKWHWVSPLWFPNLLSKRWQGGNIVLCAFSIVLGTNCTLYFCPCVVTYVNIREKSRQGWVTPLKSGFKRTLHSTRDHHTARWHLETAVKVPRVIHDICYPKFCYSCGVLSQVDLDLSSGI